MTPWSVLARQTAKLYRYSKIDLRYAVATMILPIIFGLLALLPGMFVLNEILVNQGSSLDTPFRELPYPAEVKFSALMLLFTIFFSLGVIIGWFMNALVLSIVYKWKKKEIVNALLRSKYPDRWLKSPEGQLKADILQSKARQKGKCQFIMVNGVGYYGVLMFFFTSLIPALSSDSPVNHSILFFLACLWLSFGVVFGWLLWKTLIGNNRNRDKLETKEASHINHEAYRHGCTYYDQGEFDKAMEAFEVAINYRPEDGESWMALGDCFRKLYKYARAEECYRNALARVPEEFKPNVLFNLANSLFDQFRFSEAIELYQKIPEQSVVYSKAQRNLALAENDNAKSHNQAQQPGQPTADR